MNFDITSIQAMLNNGGGNSIMNTAGNESDSLAFGAFGTEFSEQLALLQQQLQDGHLPDFDVAGLQNFSLQNGMTLPMLSAQTNDGVEDIDLQETFQMLSDILYTIGLPQDNVLPPVAVSPHEIAFHTEPVSEFLEEGASDKQATVLASLAADEHFAEGFVELTEQNAGPTMLDTTLPEEQLSAVETSTLSSSVKPEGAAEQPDEAIKLGSEHDEETSAFSSQTQADDDNLEWLAQKEPPAADKMEAHTDDNTHNVFKTIADLAINDRMPARTNSAELAPMNSRMADPDWGNELAQRLVFMHKQAIPAAQLNLNPKHLGPVSIRVNVDNDNTSIAFSVQHGVVKEAIEAALPKLKEMLGGQQLNLVDVNVSQQQSEQKSSSAFMMGSGGKQREQQDEAQQQLAPAEQEMTVLDEIEAGRAIAKQGVLSIFA